jgi:hypothetical protein
VPSQDRSATGRLVDGVSELCDRVRPTYPDDLVANLVAIPETHDGSLMLEVDSGIGPATPSLGAVGFSVAAVEPTAGMSDLARQRLGRLTVLVLTLLTLGLTACSPTPGVGLALGRPGTPFAATSVWNIPLPINTPVNPNNTDYLNVIAENNCGKPTAVPETPVTCTPSPYSDILNITAFSAPLYVVPADQPKVSVTAACPGEDRGFSYAFLNSIAGGVPVPADAHAAAGSDQEIQIYQPSTNHYWEFWRFQRDSSGNWNACWGGEITDVSQSDGIFPNELGATGTSLPLLGSVVRIEELQSGQIDHAIGLVIGDDATANLNSDVDPANTSDPNRKKPGVSWPATHGDGRSSDPNAIPEGTRFRFPASLDLSQYDLTPIARVIASAAQKYGFIVNDSSPTPTLSLRLGDPTTYIAAGLPNPYTSGPGVDGQGTQGLLDGGSQNAIMQNFPWDELQALPYDYGEHEAANNHH